MEKETTTDFFRELQSNNIQLIETDENFLNLNWFWTILGYSGIAMGSIILIRSFKFSFAVALAVNEGGKIINADQNFFHKTKDRIVNFFYKKNEKNELVLDIGKTAIVGAIAVGGLVTAYILLEEGSGFRRIWCKPKLPPLSRPFFGPWLPPVGPNEPDSILTYPGIDKPMYGPLIPQGETPLDIAWRAYLFERKFPLNREIFP